MLTGGRPSGFKEVPSHIRTALSRERWSYVATAAAPVVGLDREWRSS